jgi:signal transduction histidine kinase/DNA-binding response OmpR family regulator
MMARIGCSAFRVLGRHDVGVAGRSAVFLLLALCAVLAWAAGGENPDPEARRREIISEVDYDPGAALMRGRQALQDARQRGDKHAELNALLLLSIAHAMVGDAAKPREDEATGEALARELGDAHTGLWFAERIAWIRWGEGHHEEAERMWDEAIVVSERNGWTVRKGWMLVNRAVAHQVLGRRGEALAMLAQAYEQFDRAKDSYGMAHALIYTADTYGGPDAVRADNAHAAELYAHALGMVDTRVHRMVLFKVLVRLGSAHMRIDRLDDALRELRQALDTARLLKHVAGQMNALLFLGETEVKLGDADAALQHLDQLLEIAAQHPPAPIDMHNPLRALLDSAELLARRGERDRALARIASAAEIVSRQDTPFNRSRFERQAAATYAALGDYAKAYEHLQAARAADRRLIEASRVQLDAEYRARFEVELKETENELLRVQRREAENLRNMLLVAGVSIVVVLGALVLLLRKRAQAARMAAEHNLALAEAEAATSRAKSEFVSSMSHELRSPLNAMLGFSRLLLRDQHLSEQARRDVSIVLNSGEHLYTLINQVLELSKIEAGRAGLQPAPLDVQELIAELREMFSLGTSQKGLQLRVEADADVPQHVQVDGVKLRQVLVNLLANAVKFTSAGTVSLGVRFAAGRLAFEVKDTGVGISEAELAHLGEAFVQADAGRRAGEGTGLGLSISRAFVHLMGGDLRITSRLGEGTCADFDIPVQLLAAAPAAPPAAGHIMGLPRSGDAPRILVVDDLRDSRLLLVRLLEPRGFAVREASDGHEAIEQWQQWSPHLILMDMRMPRLDGREATRHIRAAEQDGRHAIIVALTASSFEEEREQILALGCDDFLRKPFREEVLLETLARHLGLNYERGAPSTAAADTLTHADLEPRLVALPRELRDRLQVALQRLDVAGIELVLEDVRAHDADTARALSPVLERFEYGQIVTLLEQAST